MKCSALWHGGSSYAVPTLDDIEHFASIAQASAVLLARARNSIGPRGGIRKERG